jgi:hypothetical protein
MPSPSLGIQPEDVPYARTVVKVRSLGYNYLILLSKYPDLKSLFLEGEVR